MNDIDQTALEIARAFIPVDVVGQQRANLQVAIIEAIKKHANPKTLADVQPGGMVRLGDQRSDLVPGIVRCAKCQFQLVRSNLNMHDGTVTAGDSKTEPCPNGCGPLWPVTWETWAREGWAEAERLHLENAALSAQPSPGGQDALDCIGRIEEAIEFRVPHDIYAAVHGDLAELKAALAARQPVGEVSVKKEDANNYCLILRALGMEEEGDPVAEVRALIDARDRQPVGEPVARSIIEEFVQCADVGRAPGKLLAQARDYLAAPPAQAVDLGQFREAIAEWRSNWANYGRTMTSAGRDTSKARRNVDEADRLLALIDGKAVGNG